jgi:hypothetical protein
MKSKKIKTRKLKTKKMKSKGGALKTNIERGNRYVNEFKRLYDRLHNSNNVILKNNEFNELLDVTRFLSANMESLVNELNVLDVATKTQIYEKIVPTITTFKQLSQNRSTGQPIKLKIATYENFPPIVGFKNGMAYGFEIELIKLIFDTEFLSNYGINLCFEFVRIEQYDKLWQLPGDCNLAIGGFSKTRQRENQIKKDQKSGALKKNIFWSIPYYHVKRTLIYKKNDAEMIALAKQFEDASKVSNNELNRVMHDAPPNSIFVATALSTGYYDTILRLGRTHEDITKNTKNTNPKIEFGTTNEEDIRRLKTEPNVRGLMRGSDVAKEIVDHDPEQSLAMITPWNIHKGIVYNYGINDSSNEGFSVTGDDINLILFINLRIIQLFQTGKIDELTQRMLRGEFDFNKVVPNYKNNCEDPNALTIPPMFIKPGPPSLFSLNFVTAAGISLLSFVLTPKGKWSIPAYHPENPPIDISYYMVWGMLQYLLMLYLDARYQKPGLFKSEVKQIKSMVKKEEEEDDWEDIDDGERPNMQPGGMRGGFGSESMNIFEMLGKKLSNSEKEKIKEWYESPGSKIIIHKDKEEIIDMPSKEFMKLLVTELKPLIMQEINKKPLEEMKKPLEEMKKPLEEMKKPLIIDKALEEEIKEMKEIKYSKINEIDGGRKRHSLK